MTHAPAAERRPDGALVQSVLAGNVDAYGELVRRYQHTYARFAVRMLGSPEDADDALQSAFVRAFRALSQCQDPERFSGWLYQIVINECRTLAMRRDRRERRLVRVDGATGLPSVPPHSKEQELREEIEYALARLPMDQREAFLLKYVEGRSYEEMSEMTGAGVSALKMRVKRACERLRELLGGVYDPG